jgi:hypothetical protein
MLVIALLWLILLILCLSNRTGLKVFAVASVVLWGAIFATMIADRAADADRTAAMKAGTFDCKASVAANDCETYTRTDVWGYCSGVFGGEARWEAFLRAEEARRDAKDEREAE